ncbi:hypothetical protein FRC07_014047, partial [Ceratobasidium sp. 392]
MESTLRTALANNSIKPVDISILERIEHSRDVNLFLDRAAPRLVYQLLQSHAKRTPADRFLDDRYGQICLRILIRLVQIIVCAKNGTLEYAKIKMEDAVTDTEVSAFLAEHTAALAMGETKNTRSFLTASGLIGYAESQDLFSDNNTREIVELLWENRKSVLTLYR